MDQPDDDLLRRARNLGAEAEQAQRDNLNASADDDHGLLYGAAWWRKLMLSLEALRDVLGPFGVALAWFGRLLLRWFRWAAFRADGADPVRRRLSLPRLLGTVPLSLAGLMLLHVLFAAIYYYGTAFEETVYVTGKQEIETGERYQFGGCTSLPCSTETDNGKFYLIESSLYFPVMYYPEENVFANIPQQNSACRVRGYGIYFRTLRWMYKSMQLYQHVVDVSCRPYTDEEIRRAVSGGEIVRDAP